ncbi:MAG: TonB-dependent receptor [Halioglobus sp.]
MFTKKSLIGSAVLGVISSGALFSTSALAQNDGAMTLEEIVVTARKREEPLQQVPVAVTAISEQLNRSTVRNLQDTQAFAPNIIIDKVSAGAGSAAISIRGISYQEIEKSWDAPVGVVVDGVFMGNNAGQLMDNFDIDRIEVLRGPQGTLFGKNTNGGAISIIHSAPTKELGGKLRLAGGNWDKRDIQGLLNLPLGEKGGLKLYASKLQHDGYIKNTTYGDDQGSQDYLNYGATIAFDVTDNFYVSFNAERTDDDSEIGAWANFNKYDEDGTPELFVTGDLACLISEPLLDGCRKFDTGSDEDHSSTNGPNWSDVISDFYNLTMAWDVGNWTLTSITGYVDREESNRLEYDANSYEVVEVINDNTWEQFSQELRGNAQLGSVNLTVGAYYWESEYNQNLNSFDMWYHFGYGGEPGEIAAYLGSNGDNTSYAGFVNADWAITDQWILNLGGRYTWEEKTFTGAPQSWYSSFTGATVIPGGPEVSYKEDWNEFTPRVALSYQANDDLMFFGSYSEGFKSGGYFARVASVDLLTPYEPEYVSTWELGMKSEWLDNRLRFNGTLFYSDYEDKQEDVIQADASGTVGTVILNAGDAEMYGVELEFTALITSGLTAFLNVGYLHSEYTDFDADVNGDGMVTDNTHLTIRNAPETTFGTGFSYDHSLGGAQMGWNYNYFWRDEYVSIFNNDPLGVVKAAGFHNASVDINFMDNYRISFYGRNLGDERYARPVLIPPLSSFGQYNEPRNYGIEFTATF